MRPAALIAALAATLAPLGPVRAGLPFSGWAAVVVAGDDEAAHEDTPTKAFDNARRDVAAAFERRGFEAANLAQFTLRPDLYPTDHAERSDLKPIASRLRALAARAPAGCLVYLTSHGSPDGVVIDNRIVRPRAIAAMVGRACGERPTAVIVSACFSGVFLPRLAGPDRFVLTAARRDRSSFGCSEDDRYPFFDGCLIAQLPKARDFIDLAGRVRRCVAEREDAEGMRPRSQPQVFVGREFRARVGAFPPSSG